MKRNFFAIVVMALACLFTACGSKDSGTKQLILYYSQTGATESVAQELQKVLSADVEAIVLEEPYTGTYAETLDRVGKERQSGNLPKLNPLKADLSKYDVVFLGYPIWFGTYALPIASLVKEYDFEQWQALGHDHHSVIADPCFADAQNGDFTVTDSTVLDQIGFKPFEGMNQCAH